MTSSELLTTGQAARLLGTSRQHVVDLCRRGTLACSSTGTHRRVKRRDIEALARGDVKRGALTPDQLRSLWLHRAVAGHLVREPERVLGRARANLDRLSAVHPTGMSAHWIANWRAVIEAGAESTMRVLTAISPEAVELRQNSPFAGVLSDDERQAVLAAFRRQRSRP
jgi:excisionase family DNA binding protein